MNEKQRVGLLREARKLIGTKYGDMDCSAFVHSAYGNAGMRYPYRNTQTFASLAQFQVVNDPRPGDVVLWTNHMGLLDPEGCLVTSTTECKRLGGNARILSSRSGGNRGVEYGRAAWFGSAPTYHRWST